MPATPPTQVERAMWEVAVQPGKVLILGGGAAGLTAAIALGKRGFDVEVIEKDHDWTVAEPLAEGLAIHDHEAFGGVKIVASGRWSRSPLSCERAGGWGAWC
jgi:pyruvate/2-oxoglutarate dehydrogenase complex dihydrolipoamide dehydrogenase (E3) component